MVLDLARSGAPLKATATFHGTLTPKAPAQKGNIQGEVLVLHGELDSMVTLEDVANFEKEMQAAEVKHEVVVLKMLNMALVTRLQMKELKRMV